MTTPPNSTPPRRRPCRTLTWPTSDLHEAGYLLAAGPLLNDRFRGLSILKADAEETRRLKEADPAVQAGRFDVIVMPWMVPAGAMHFAPARFPRSMAEIE